MTGNNDLSKLRQMVKDIDFCMLTTLDEKGNPHSRPMSTNKEIEFDGDLWFFTYGNSHKVHEIDRLAKVNVSFADPDKQRWISMTGTADIVRDKRKMQQLWKPHLKAWFPNGLDEPDIALLKVNVESAEYWNNPSSTISQAISFASSIITGQPANVGENKQIDMKSGVSTSKDFTEASGQKEGRNRLSERMGLARKRNKFNETNSSSLASTFMLIGGAGLGAALMYLFDPDRGRGRRAYLSDKTKSLSNKTNRYIEKTKLDLSNRVQGVMAETGISKAQSKA
jgi:general stress protein 26